ncbi:T9SS type A sorting domain-containing protein [Saccharicrinis sp. FJH54]|uniref:T9SS type A sorting domain-containing protein n=1 Tax=Saccharicrinis sp. FJH54 TaxID=3344665 RepID=UPI0035D48C68
MKKLLLFTLVWFCAQQAGANPLIDPPPNIWISEIGFDSTGNWMIELQYEYVEFYHNYNSVDSIFISSSTARAKLVNYTIKAREGLLLVSNDSLMSEINIDMNGDSLQIEYYYNYYSGPGIAVPEPIVYGNYRAATLRAPGLGETIASCHAFSSISAYTGNVNYINYYSIDSSPGFGSENNSTGMCATIYGNIYDESNELLTDFNRKIYAKGSFGFVPGADGSYSVQFLSFKNQISQLYYTYGWSNYIVDIIPISIDPKPDTVIVEDIHIQKITSVQEVKTEQVKMLRIAPNPVRGSVFNYEIVLPIKSSECYLELVSLNGQSIAQFSISESKGMITVPSDVENGMYILRLYINKKNYGTSKILISR